MSSEEEELPEECQCTAQVLFRLRPEEIDWEENPRLAVEREIKNKLNELDGVGVILVNNHGSRDVEPAEDFTVYRQ